MLTERRQAPGGIPLPKREAGRSNEKLLWGTFTLSERWGLSGRGWLLLGLLICGMVAAGFLSVQPFLAVTERIPASILVVEGWVPNYVIRGAVQEFNTGSYKHIYTTGGPIIGDGGYTNDYNTSASVAAGRLRAAGLPSELIQMVPSRVLDRDRTYSAAIALRKWLKSQQPAVHGINVLTEGPHARRTRLLFQKALGNDVRVGVIATANPDYDARRWWRYSEGVREVIGEGLSYIYAKLFFYPARPEQIEKTELTAPNL